MATAVISASEAMHYIHSLWIGLPIIPATIFLLAVFMTLTIIGITESAVVAVVIFITHLATLGVLIVFGLSYLFFHGPDLLFANFQTPPPGGLGAALVFGFAAAMLGVSGFESSANFRRGAGRGGISQNPAKHVDRHHGPEPHHCVAGAGAHSHRSGRDEPLGAALSHGTFGGRAMAFLAHQRQCGHGAQRCCVDELCRGERPDPSHDPRSLSAPVSPQDHPSWHSLSDHHFVFPAGRFDPADHRRRTKGLGRRFTRFRSYR